MWASDMALQKSEESMNFNLDREPRRHLNADFKIEKEKRQRMKLTVVLYGRWNFSECKSANRLINRVDTGPKPPDVEKTRGEKQACSTSLIC